MKIIATILGLLLIGATPEQQEIKIPGSDLAISMVRVDVAENEHDLWMSTHEITWDLYELFLFRNVDSVGSPMSTTIDVAIDGVSGATTPYIDMSYGMGKEGFPVTNVTQYAASTFCEWLSAKTGHFFRLPMEAEWEAACRSGSSKKYSFGNNKKELVAHAWYDKNAKEKYQEVGQKQSNIWGLYDMHGNVSEWVLNEDQLGNSTTSLYPRKTCGGSWKTEAEELTCDARQLSSPNWKKTDPQLPKSLWWHTDAPFIGFRVVMDLSPPEDFKKYWVNPIEEY